VALGANSASLCRDIGVVCPVYPAKGHLVTVSSRFDHRHNLTLDGGLGYAAPMAYVDSLGRRLYRLSGFVDFTPTRDADPDRIEALVDATRSHLPDLEVVDASACHRPISADDRALIGPSGDKFSNLYLATGFGSRGWTIGLGSGKLLASQMLGMPCDIDPTPYLPSRFSFSYKERSRMKEKAVLLK
jgi:D-amino-acid dehydrogenase